MSKDWIAPVKEFESMSRRNNVPSMEQKGLKNGKLCTPYIIQVEIQLCETLLNTLLLFI